MDSDDVHIHAPSLRVPVLPQGPQSTQDKKRHKRKPQAQLRAMDGALIVADWASLVGDLSRRPGQTGDGDDPVEWRVHDKTHLEFAIDYLIAQEEKVYTWEAYFFVPESFRLDKDTYDKKEIYDDLLSYVRLAVPQIPFHELARDDEPSLIGQLRSALMHCQVRSVKQANMDEAVNILRLFACCVRASGVASLREIEQSMVRIATDEQKIEKAIQMFTATCSAVTLSWRAVMREAMRDGVPDVVQGTARWVDEDISLQIEMLCASLALSLRRKSEKFDDACDWSEQVAARAVAEARHRERQSYDSIGRSEASSRNVEHLEFRRHVLKRFTSSILWLTLEVKHASSWALHIFYAFAAGCAMAFALFANRQADQNQENLWRYAVLVILAYAIKDRMKAVLQSIFSNFVEKRFPDRKWTIRDKHRKQDLGQVRERAGFVHLPNVPEAVVRTRKLTREHPLEDDARPERVLWHEKMVSVAPNSDHKDIRFPMLTEIFRLNLLRWLIHTDDPNRKIVFADPDDANIYTALARRVYNINVVYRLREGENRGAWHRLRVVVSRKGIERIDSIC